MDCVIGSGPAGVACAKALLERGRSVLMLDAGLTLEPERVTLVERMAALPPHAWSAADLAVYRGGVQADARGVPRKLVYGSDFAYRGAERHLGLRYSKVGLRPSLARGGLSNVWGAALLPYLPGDVKDWPLPIESLAPDYSAVLQLTGLAAGHDDLERFFPLYASGFSQLRLSNQADRLWRAMQNHREELAAAGIVFGRARLAVQGQLDSSSAGCRYCRQCMYGCPYGYIYNSAQTVQQFQRRPGFQYEPGVVVKRVVEKADGVEITGYDLESGLKRRWECARVFIAAGAIPTTRILLSSLEAYGQDAWLKDSQYFLLPLLLRRRVRGASREELHALSQIFVELFHPEASGKAAHVQIYSHNDLVTQAIEQAFGLFRFPLRWLIRELEERLLVAQGFLHSDYSGRICVRLEPNEKEGQGALELTAEENPASAGMVKKVVRYLRRHARQLGAMPLSPLLKIAEPGRSFHCGGSFPMSSKPRGFQSDLLGRPTGWKRVHAVDATVLPSIPATTITLSVMANAHRIGRLSDT